MKIITEKDRIKEQRDLEGVKRMNEMEKTFDNAYLRLSELESGVNKWKFEIGRNSFNFEENLENLHACLAELSEELAVLGSFDGLPLFQRTISGLEQEVCGLEEENERLAEEIEEQKEMIARLRECLERNDQDEYRLVIKPGFEK